jgi:2-methylcitrate dehydratase PrpD
MSKQRRIGPPTALAATPMTRRAMVRGVMTTAGALGIDALIPVTLFAQRGTSTNAARPDYTLALARFVHDTSFRDLPPKAIDHAKMILASTFASAAAGSDIESARILRQLAKDQGGKLDAPIWFDGTRLPAVEAARVNAALSDAAASDDSDIRNTAHEGTTLTAAGLAIGERVSATGQELLAAMVLGYETAGRIGEARTGGPGGLHASQIVAFAGAACAAKLMKLTDVQTANALGIVATTVGGLATGTNSWAREYMGANAAASGVDAAMAAGRGYAVNDDMLGSRGGFVDVFGGGNRTVDRLTADLGRTWNIVDYLAIKLWPGAHPFSGTVEAAMNAARQSNVPPDAVSKILVAGQNRTAIDGSRRPANLAEAIHSLAYYVAAAVADKDFTWAHATPSKYSDPRITKLMDLVEIDPAPPPATYKWSWGGTVTIVTTTGARFTSTVDAPRGSGPRGIEWSDVEAKFRALMPESKLSASRLSQILDRIHRLEGAKTVSELTRLLVPGQ